MAVHKTRVLLLALILAAPASAQTIALPETSVAEHAAVSTNDSRVIIEVRKVQDNSVSLAIIVDAKEPLAFEQKPGDRITLNAEEDAYEVDIRRTHGNTVDIAVSQHRR